MFLKYEEKEDDANYYSENYYIINNKNLYTLKQKSILFSQSTARSNEFVKIVNSLEFLENQNNINKNQNNTNQNQNNTNQNQNNEFQKYINKNNEVSFQYPKDWKIVENNKDTKYNHLLIVSPDYSGPIDILVTTSELNNYHAPYNGKTVLNLSTSYFLKDEVMYIYKLTNFLDTGERNKLCFSKDIIKDGKIVSLFISVSDYLTIDGAICNEKLKNQLDNIADSFLYIKNSIFLNTDTLKKSIQNKIENYILFSAEIDIGNLNDILPNNLLENNFMGTLNSNYYIPVYVKFNDILGYFVIKIDCIKENIYIVSYTPVDALISSIEEKYSIYKNEYIIKYSNLKSNNNFEIITKIISNITNTSKLEYYRILIDDKIKIIYLQEQ